MEIFKLTDVDNESVAAFERLMPQLTHLPAPTRTELEEMASSQNCLVLVARADDGQIVGSGALGLYRTPTGLHAWIEDVVVDEAYRQQGIGEAIILALVDAARERRAHSLSLTSRPAREAANRLYQRLGFMRWETNLYRYPL